ncbi:LOW QUALITY PROTEIN: guanylate cyclase soluble subunit beta-2-like [Melospiza georgiana]|uniref:LOW QUALITY PROTEIN: guanylate cyclase soluble subunit beta-2-like n=1 Tax=Melospiza georgiana TaxID=44398 RepID=UPI0025ABFFA1|nr:LOW QUALITY PROTEIN: guanylate cyclase soluble subunit beta-2-like [Melospiza georgiana]
MPRPRDAPRHRSEFPAQPQLRGARCSCGEQPGPRGNRHRHRHGTGTTPPGAAPSAAGASLIAATGCHRVPPAVTGVTAAGERSGAGPGRAAAPRAGSGRRGGTGGSGRMYGFINTCLKSLVVEKYGEETWEKLRLQAGVQDSFLTFEVYKDEITMQLVDKACKVLGVPADIVLREFGKYFFEFCKRSGYDHMLRTLGGNLYEFIENLDALHSYLSLSYQEMNAPSFRVEKNEDGSMHLHYYSDRRGLCHIVPGIIGAAALDFFNIEISMKIVNQTEEEERTGKKEHIVFLVTQNPLFPCKERNEFSSSSQCLVDSEKQIENQLKKEGLEKAKNANGDRGNSVCPVKKSHWKTLRGIITLGKGKLLRGFDPVYPKSLWIDTKTFCNGLPFHMVFDKELKVKQAGVSIQKIVPGLQTMGISLDQYFRIVHPEVPFTISSIQKFINSQFVFQTRREMMPESWRERPMLELRGQMMWMEPLQCMLYLCSPLLQSLAHAVSPGQMMWMEPLQCMLYLCSPLLRSLHELEERQMHIADIAPHDVTRDLILLNQQRLAEMELSSQLERKKEELRILSKHLEEEKKKTEALLYAMLPQHVANQLKEGKRVEAGEFKECTILFSDVVTFTNICAQCEPIQIVLMLNSMYLRFDRLTTVHDVYKVETIGDAYMVVGGVPVPVPTHAERVANFALGMIMAAKGVQNPVSGNPIQIRVGIHTGPVLAGVVGEKMPRYCLFGDTVNIASRMESHGVPSKIHLSSSAYQCLKYKNFEITERGEIEVKGKGKMHTYFLIRNKSATENEIMGRPMKDLDSGHESVQSIPEGKIETIPSSHQPATQAQQKKDQTPAIAMKYVDGPTDAQNSLKRRNQMKAGDLTGKTCDSKSDGSLHGNQHADDGPRPPNQGRVRPAAEEPQNRNVRSNFCTLL